MSDDLNDFFSKVPEGWGLVPMHGPQPEEPEKPASDHRTLVGRFPSTEVSQRPSDNRGHARLAIDAVIDAKRRRHVREPVQLAWDAETDATLMMRCVCGDHGLSGVIPLAKIMERLKVVLAGRAGSFARVDDVLPQRALHSAARFFFKGDIEWAIRLMAPIHALVVRRPGPEAMHEVLATFIRDLFPSAPQNYVPPQRRVGAGQVTAPRTLTMGGKQEQAQRTVQVKHAPDLEKVKQMQPERARMLLPAMRQAYQQAPSEQKEQFAQAIEAMRKIVESVDGNSR